VPVRGRWHTALVAGVAIALAPIASGCGSDSSTQPQPGVGPSVGAPINLADCTDWNNANTAERLGTIEQLENFAGGPVVGGSASDPSGTGAVLDDDEAYDLLTRYCEPELARGFKLYKLYVRAAAFSGQAQ
jgi:hypothetical protein